MAAAVEAPVELDVDLDKVPECHRCGEPAHLRGNFHGCNHVLICRDCEALHKTSFDMVIVSRDIRCAQCRNRFRVYSDWVTIRLL